ncbi:hypothetical protein WA026_001840 [Henosepilachna vigintioctopunctata]|uniref:Aldose 1-epimerase n=1 Tax=Henosepilachna vigintioctopunctata TaxID=420089 RepID=A0AAW1USB4_9CUCU
MKHASEVSKSVKIREEIFDQFVDPTTGQSSPVWKITWTNSNNVSTEVITYGATITSIKVPDKNGVCEDLVMGFKDIKGYQGRLNPYFGATVGRVANRIGNSRFTINGTTYAVSANLPPHQLHGGFRGFDKVNWDYIIQDTKVTMSYLSKDKEEGFPGDLITHVSFILTESNEFKIEFMAHTTKPTFVNLTNHSYFNLAGHNKGAAELYKHVVSINADQTTDVDKDSIPSGKLLKVAGTIFDLRIPKVLGDVIHKIPGYDGYDHNFCITKGEYQEESFVARVHHPGSGRVLEVYSNQPGVQFYTSNGIPENAKDFKGNPKNLQVIIGKDGPYYKHGALCLETQNYPDAINHPGFPKAILNPGETYRHSLIYKFSVDK